jgi:NADPH-dependent 2,4-dienoyl-CoA reductase/sulfur reductase-like enzyme
VAEHASLARVAGFAVQLPRWPSKLLQAFQLQDNAYRTNSTVLSVQGQGKVESVTLQQGSSQVTLDCDRVACGYGLVPNTALAESLGCSTHSTSDGMAAIRVDALQATSQPGIYAAGECTGIGGSERAMAQGRMAGYAAIDEIQTAQSHGAERERWSAFAASANACFTLDDSLKKLPAQDTLVCRCEDVSHGALQAHSSWTAAKMHTRCGMGACQGKVCGTAARFLYGWQTPEARVPLTVARIGTLAATAAPGKD